MKITFGRDTSSSYPSLLISSINTDKCNSPRPQTSKLSGEAVSLTRKLTFLSSSLNNLSLMCLDVTNSPSCPAKGPLFTLNVIETVGSSMFTNGIFSGFAKSQIVSPMLMSGIPDIATISPASTSSTSTLFNPMYVNNLAIFPCVFFSCLQIETGIPFFILPRSILPIAILPK